MGQATAFIGAARLLRLPRNLSPEPTEPASPPHTPPADVAWATTSSAFAIIAHHNGTSLLTTKPSLIAFSHVMEDDCSTPGPDTHLFAFFQGQEFYRPAREVWRRMAAGAASAHVFADFAGRTIEPSDPVEVPLTADDPMLQEWAVVVDRPGSPMAMAARQRPGQEHLPESRRLFDSSWTTHPPTVRKASHLCATLARHRGSSRADLVAADLAITPAPITDERLADRLLDHLLGRLLDRLPPEPIQP